MGNVGTNDLFSKLRDIKPSELFFYSDCLLLALQELNRINRFKLSQGKAILQLMTAIESKGGKVSKTYFFEMTGQRGVKSPQIKEYLRPFFFIDPDNGVTLTMQGKSLANSYITIFRRVLSDKEEYLRLKFKRHTPGERQKRRLAKRFYSELSEEEQIKVLRDYYSLPFRTPEEKLIRKRARIEIFHKYDLINWDLLNAIKRFGPLVTSVRNRPELIHLFPHYQRKPYLGEPNTPGKPEN